MTTLYSGEDKTMEQLKQFLNDHRGQPLEFVCDDLTEFHDYEPYE